MIKCDFMAPECQNEATHFVDMSSELTLIGSRSKKIIKIRPYCEKHIVIGENFVSCDDYLNFLALKVIES